MEYVIESSTAKEH